VKNNNKNKIYNIIYGLIFLSIIALFAFNKSNLVWHSNVSRYIDKIHNQTISVKGDTKFSYKGKNYRIIFGTSEDKKDDLFLQCFQEKLNGLFYEPTYGAYQGKSKSLYGMTNHYIHGENDSFFVVYGYNKEFEANNFSVRKTSDGEWITQDISKQEYFLYTYTNIEYTKIVFKDMHNNDISGMFNGW
jgi:hypothetical protein